MSRTEDRSSTPRAVIHKRILDVAESDPSASMEEISREIGGASTELVERVLEQYGDPAGEDKGSQDDIEVQGNQEEFEAQESHDDMQESAPTPDFWEPDMQTDENGRSDEDDPELSEKQLKTLRLIEQRPGATQGDLAEEFGVTRATVSRWLNDIPQFDWQRRTEIVSEILNGSDVVETPDPTESGSTESERTDEISQRLDAVERRLDELEDGAGTESASVDPELAHKVVHACMRSDRITEAEELQLLKQLMG